MAIIHKELNIENKEVIIKEIFNTLRKYISILYEKRKRIIEIIKAKA